MKNKFAILSHILPPSPSGQAIVLYRLLENIPKNDYILVSSRDYSNSRGEPKSSEKLSGKYFYLNSKDKIKISLLSRLFLDIPFTNQLAHFLSSIKPQVKNLKKILKKEKCEILIVCSGALPDLLISYLAIRKSNVKLVIYSFDDVVFQWVGLPRLAAKIINSYILKKADKLIVPNEFLQKEYFKRYKKKSVIVRNPLVFSKGAKIENIFSHKNINIIYTGSVYHAHFDAFKNLILAIETIKMPIVLHLFTDQSEIILKKEGIISDSVKVHENIDQKKVITLQKQADILFLPLAFNCSIKEVIKTSAPGKMGEYLISGKPILVHAPKDSFLTWYFKKKKAGMVVDELSLEKLVKAILKIISDKNNTKTMIKNAKIASEDFSVNLAKENFMKVIN